MTAKRTTRISQMIAFALGLIFTLAACGTQESLDAPDTLAMVEESTTILSEPEAPVTEAPVDPPAADAPVIEPPVTEAPLTEAPVDPPVIDAPAAPASGDQLVEAEAESFRLLNELRASLGLTAVVRSGEMDSFARNWSQTMATTGNFEHSTGPYGENIAWNSQGALTPAEAAATMHEMWVNSPGHYANMTSSDYTLAGMGFYLDATGWHATHVFDR